MKKPIRLLSIFAASLLLISLSACGGKSDDKTIRVGASPDPHARILKAAEPLLNPVWVLIFDGERPGVFALIGGVIVVVSITLWCVFGQEKPEESPRTSGELGLHN